MTPFLHPWYVDGLLAIKELAAKGEPFTSDEVHASIGEPPHFNSMGKLFRDAQNAGLIKRTGRSLQSAQPSRRKARIQEWVGAAFPIPDEPVESEQAQGALL